MKFLATLFTLSAWFRTRKYKSGTRWCFWRWTDVTDNDYILRLHIVKTPWWAICLHWVSKADAEPWMHDHPCTFFSIILRGGYAEKRQRLCDLAPRLLVHRWFNFIRASEFDTHRIMFARANTLTLCFMGPKVREWSFHTSRGRIGWQDYYRRMRLGEDMRAQTVGYTLREVEESIYPQLNVLTENFIKIHTGPFIDRDVRAIDTAPAMSRNEFYRTFEPEKRVRRPKLPWGPKK
mgnify:CR=1 FL=1